MKTNCTLILAAMLATSAIAQDNTNALPEIPPPATAPAMEAPVATETNAAPAKPKPAKKHVAPKKKISEPTVSLVPGPAEATGKVNVRGQAGLKGEVIVHLFKGDAVNVLEQINLGKHAADEPAQWAKISYPTNANVWINAKYIDADTKTVKSKKLNLRAGPGENFSVVGSVERGTPVSQIETKGSWIKIEPPASTYAFVAAMYLKQEAPVATTPTPTEIEPMPTPVPIVPQPSSVPEPTTDANIPRVATHEGIVRHVGSLITPTEYELYSSETDKNIDYLYSTTTNLDLGRYVGMRIIVTGEEGLAARWTDTPVLTVQKILVLDTNAVPQRIYRSPRQQQGRH
ncbi:MAG TPA: SH3 domain-containing protein [Methylomirabilota bacterium]|nr:SH3 domain-containing protein [Methylomirabilota bacterium]